jgi:putative Mg2+ transporter-C (MgtC) family protein
MVLDFVEMAIRVFAALVAGALIGLERTYRGRPAGFRTHALVCMSSSILMLVTVYEAYWMHALPDSIKLDPTRMAQGILTGIGFLGAGVIMQDRFTVRGLTTAASIWITSAIGILAGIGFYFPLVLSVVLTLGILSGFRWIENHMRAYAYYHFEVSCARSGAGTVEGIREIVQREGFSVGTTSYRLDAEGTIRRFTMTIATSNKAAAGALARALEDSGIVLEFRIAPTGD